MSQSTAAKDGAVVRPVSRKDMSLMKWTLKEIRRNYLAYLLLAPFYILFCIFTIVPVVSSLVISFTDFNMLETPNFVFMDNYIRLFLDDDLFLTACQNSFIFALVTGPLNYLLSLFMAWFINELEPKIRAIVTLIFYAPSISGGGLMIFQLLFSSDSYGYINAILLKLGIIDTPILFFTDTAWISESAMVGACSPRSTTPRTA